MRLWRGRNLAARSTPHVVRDDIDPGDYRKASVGYYEEKNEGSYPPPFVSMEREEDY